MEIALVLLSVGLLIFLAHLFTVLFEKIRIPDVLPLVLLGFLIGPVCGVVTTESFGNVGSVFTTIALVLILFESGLGIRFSALRNSMLWGVRLSIFNFVGTTVLVTLLSRWLFHFSVLEGVILGSILGGTSSVVVIPLVEKLRMGESSRTALLLESTFTDVLCIVVTLALLRFHGSKELAPGLMLGQMLASFILAIAIGVVGAFFWDSVLSRVRELENNIITTPAFVFIIFGLAEFFGYSGAIACLAFGVVIGNIRVFHRGFLQKLLLQPITLNLRERAFFSEMVFLVKTFFFVFIGISIRLTDYYLILAAGILTVSMFVIRIPVVRLSLGREVTRSEASLAAAMVPKGLAPAVLAVLPIQAGIANGYVIQDTVFAVVILSIILTAILTFLLERKILYEPYGLVFSSYSKEPATRKDT